MLKPLEIILKNLKTNKMKEIELHEFSKRDTEMLAEICMEYLSEKGIRPEIWSFQLKCFIETEMED